MVLGLIASHEPVIPGSAARSRKDEVPVVKPTMSEDGSRLVEEREAARAAKLEALRRGIGAGLESGDPEPHDMAAIKAEAHAEHRP